MSCYSTIRHTKIVLEDSAGKTKMCFNNPNKRKVIKKIVDNCIITKGKRCDFMLLDHNTKEYYIELKGKQVEYACLQIEETIKQLTSNIKSLKFSFVVSTACPITSTEVQVLKAKFKTKYNSMLTIKNNLCEHIIE